MKIDGDPVVQGDEVFHDRYGWGNVVRVRKGVCDVKFHSSQTVLTFTDGGYFNGIKVLWWQPPLLFTPRKGIDYTGLTAMISQLLNWKYGGS